MGAETYIFDRSIERLRELDFLLNNRCSTVYSTTLSIEQLLPEVDLVVGAVLVHGAMAPHVIKREQLALMKEHAVLVDMSIDQGGCFETSRPTTHTDATYVVDGVTLADEGVRQAMASAPGFRGGLNVAAGRVTNEPVARDQGLPHTPPMEALEASDQGSGSLLTV